MRRDIVVSILSVRGRSERRPQCRVERLRPCPDGSPFLRIAMRRSNFPYVVEITVSEGGAGKLAVYNFHARLGIVAHRVHEKYVKIGRRYVRWRFGSLTDAEKFAHQFGGSLVAGR